MASTLASKSKSKTIEEPVEKQEIWAFIEMECRVDKNISFKGNTFFQAFQTKEFQDLLQYDLSTYLSKGIYNNISKSRLHRATTKTPILPCSYVIELMTQRIDHESRAIINFEGKTCSQLPSPCNESTTSIQRISS